jgi:hypothetical protein
MQKPDVSHPLKEQRLAASRQSAAISYKAMNDVQVYFGTCYFDESEIAVFRKDPAAKALKNIKSWIDDLTEKVANTSTEKMDSYEKQLFEDRKILLAALQTQPEVYEQVFSNFAEKLTKRSGSR